MYTNRINSMLFERNKSVLTAPPPRQQSKQVITPCAIRMTTFDRLYRGDSRRRRIRGGDLHARIAAVSTPRSCMRAHRHTRTYAAVLYRTTSRSSSSRVNGNALHLSRHPHWAVCDSCQVNIQG